MTLNAKAYVHLLLLLKDPDQDTKHMYVYSLTHLHCKFYKIILYYIICFIITTRLYNYNIALLLYYNVLLILLDACIFQIYRVIYRYFKHI